MWEATLLLGSVCAKPDDLPSAEHQQEDEKERWRTQPTTAPIAVAAGARDVPGSSPFAGTLQSQTTQIHPPPSDVHASSATRRPHQHQHHYHNMTPPQQMPPFVETMALYRILKPSVSKVFFLLEGYTPGKAVFIHLKRSQDCPQHTSVG